MEDAQLPEDKKEDTTPSALEVPTQEGGGATPQPKAEPKKKKTPPKASALPNGMTYTMIVHKAIEELKDRTGSSLVAIHKKILADYPDLEGPHFKTRVSQALKSGLKSERFEKVKASYKISPKYKTKGKPKKSAATSLQETKKANTKKLEQLKGKLSEEEYAQVVKDLKKKEETAKKREQAEQLAMEREERIKKRKFPMEDTKLHEEDKKFGIKPPTDVTTRPYIPYFWGMTVPLNHPSRAGKTSQTILQASKSEGLDTGTPGLASDLLQVYHFFRGDVHFSSLGKNDEDSPIVPEFTLQHLVYATEQIMNGNARKSRMIPPLLVHLFVVCLQILCSTPVDPYGGLAEKQMREELIKYLYPAISSTSWADILYHYFDGMERYYTTDSTRNPDVVPPLNTDINFLLGVTDMAIVPMTPARGVKYQSDSHALPEGYFGYLGDSRGILSRAYAKLAKSDPWLLTAEELVACLRALTDDILATNPRIGADMSKREELMIELKRKKNKADAQLRKVRLAFEGPSKKGKKSGDDEGEKFKPTATRAQFEAAEKAQQKASDEYEKGIQKIVARTEPIGYDRNFNAIYCFRHDPEILYVEELRPPAGASNKVPKSLRVERRSWHIIESTSLFDLFTSSLDIRGKREHDLYEELMGPPGSNQSLRRYLVDDIAEERAIASRKKEREALQAKIENAIIKRDHGRKSERNLGAADLELENLEREMRTLERKIQQDEEPDYRDYEDLTGLEALRRFEKRSRLARRETRDHKFTGTGEKLDLLYCSKLVGENQYTSKGVGQVWQIVNDLLALEDLCQKLVPLEDEDVESRQRWRDNIVDLANQWNETTPLQIGSPEKPSTRATTPLSKPTSMDAETTSPNENIETPQRSSIENGDEGGSAIKKRRLETPKTVGGPSVQTIVDLLKGPVLQLEARIAEITNVNMLERDNDIADENMSVTGDAEEQVDDKRLDTSLAWKKLISRVRSTPPSRTGQIREGIVAAISAARRAQLPDVVSKLRAALLLFHSSAASECKNAAVKVLVEYGDYVEEEEDDDDDIDDLAPTDRKEEDDEVDIPSILSADMAALSGSLAGTNDANRSDWIKAVESAKTLSRFSALFAAFHSKAFSLLDSRMEQAEDLETALVGWEKWMKYEAKAKTTSKAGRPPKEIIEPSEVWADVRITKEFCMVKGLEYPWWPARKCVPKRSDIAEQLEKVDRTLVALIGEQGDLRVVLNQDIREFTGKAIEEEVGTSKYRAEDMNELDDCLAMARRLKRGYEKSLSSKLMS